MPTRSLSVVVPVFNITALDGVAALCYIVKYNLFCTRARSFAALPAPGSAAAAAAK